MMEISIDKNKSHEINIMYFASKQSSSQQNEKPSLKRATQEQKESFPTILTEKLATFSIPDSILNCRNVKCKDVEHCEKADEFICQVLACVEEAAAEALPIPKTPHTQSPQAKVVPGWKQFVKPFRDKAHFWHQVWDSAGRPLNTELHRIMKKTRNLFHFQYRKCKKAENMIKKNKLLDACINGNGDIFVEIKKMRKSKPKVATSMDGVNKDIPGHFKSIFKNLYNSANDKYELLDVLKKVEDASLYDVNLEQQKLSKKLPRI